MFVCDGTLICLWESFMEIKFHYLSSSENWVNCPWIFFLLNLFKVEMHSEKVSALGSAADFKLLDACCDLKPCQSLQLFPWVRSFSLSTQYTGRLQERSVIYRISCFTIKIASTKPSGRVLAKLSAGGPGLNPW